MLDLKTDALMAMREAAVLFHEVVTPICRKHGVTVQQMLVLAELEERPHQMATQLADRVGILRTNFAAVCCRIEAKGLISREHSKADRRRVHLDATRKGLDLLERVTEEFGQTLEQNASVLNENDYVAVRDGMSALAKLMAATIEA